MTSISLHIASERRDLMQDAITVEHAYSAEVDTDGDGSAPAKQFAHLCWGCRSRQIPVEMRVSEKRIADGSAHAPRFKASPLQLFGNLEHGGGRMERHQDRKKAVNERAAARLFG